MSTGYECPSCNHVGDGPEFDPEQEDLPGEILQCPECGFFGDASEFESLELNLIVCPDCGEEFNPDVCANCPHCEAEVVTCTECGDVIETDPHVGFSGEPYCDDCHSERIG